MLVRTNAARRARPGAVIPESALVLSVFLLLLFGMFEYCRFLMVLQVTNNAARDGARYAVVNVNRSDSQQAQTDIINYTKDRLSGIQNNFQGPVNVAVYSCDSSGFTQTPPKVVAKSSPAGKTVDPFSNYNSTSNPLAPWNSAAFTEKIAVTIQGVYKPILPVHLFMPSVINFNITAVMGSEG